MSKIKLRDYQTRFVNSAIAALQEHKNTLQVLPTGGGKTIIISGVIHKILEQQPKAKFLVLQHRKEIFDQNIAKLKMYCGEEFFAKRKITIGEMNAEAKEFGFQICYAMQQTLALFVNRCREELLAKHLDYDYIIVDEAHHLSAASYKDILPIIGINSKLYGITATPYRGDNKTLGEFFNNISAKMWVTDLINRGQLVTPEFYTVSLNRTSTEDFKVSKAKCKTQGELEKLYDLSLQDDSDNEDEKYAVALSKVYEVWRDKAYLKKTVVFAASVAMSQSLERYFNDKFQEDGRYTCAHIDAKTPKSAREEVLNRFANGDIIVVSNQNILTEGWDCPIVECIILLTESSHKTTYLQKVGRGLRTAPNKEKCIVLDFGLSSEIHQCFEQQLEEKKVFKENKTPKLTDDEATVTTEEEQGESKADLFDSKQCTACHSYLPKNATECDLCGEVFIKVSVTLKRAMEHVSKMLSFTSIYDNIAIASSYKCFCVIYKEKEKERIIVGFPYNKDNPISYIDVMKCTEPKNAIKYVEELFRQYNDSYFNVQSDWVRHTATQKQIEFLNKNNIAYDESLTKYKASCLLAYHFNKRNIDAFLNN